MFLAVRFLIKLYNLLLEYSRGTILYVKISICGGKCSSVPRVHKNLIFKYPPHNGISIGKKCFFGPNMLIEVPPYAKLTIGDQVSFASNTVISAEQNISIGNNSLIAEFVSIRDAEHCCLKSDLVKNQSLIAEAVVIGPDVWIGRSACVLMGSHLAEGTVIGANSLIKKKTTNSYTVYVGTPVKEIAKRA